MEKTYKLTEVNLESYKQTIKEIFRLSRKYFMDLLEFTYEGKVLHCLSPKEFFDYIQNKEYVKDPQGIEFVNRPKISLLHAGSKHPFDCDDRTVLCLSYLMLVNEVERIFGRSPKYEYRVLVVGRQDKPHHVYCEFREYNAFSWISWIPFDPTYPRNVFGKPLFDPGYKTIHYEDDFS